MGVRMEVTMSKDFRLILGKLSMDIGFANVFFSAKADIINSYKLTSIEKNKLLELKKERFEAYKENVLQSCDCDSCCNGGQGKGECTECFCSCCQ